MAAYCSNFGHCAFLCPLWGRGLGTTYDVHLRLIGKRAVDFLLVLRVTAEALQAKINRK